MVDTNCDMPADPLVAPFDNVYVCDDTNFTSLKLSMKNNLAHADESTKKKLKCVWLRISIDGMDYHLSMLAMIATFSMGTCSNVAQCEDSVRFSLRIGSHRGNGAVIP